MKKLLDTYWQLLLFSVVWLGIFYAKWGKMGPQEKILYVTFMAIVWYSWETHLLKKETQWATETSIRPFLALDFVDVSSPSGEWPHQYRLEMQNIGKGAAFKVVGVLELIVDLKDTKESKQINLIPVAEKGLGTWPIAIFDGQKLSGTVRLDYSDVMGKKFHTICTIGVVEKSKPNLSLSKWGYS